MKIKSLAYLLILTFTVVFTVAGSSKSDKTNKIDETDKTDKTDKTTVNTEVDYLSGLHYVEIEVENYGTISVELDADNAPITVTNFINLVSEGFYDGLTFHRVIKGFMIQGGDPSGDGTGGAEEIIKGEFPSNGVDNPLLNTRGAIAMARTKPKDSASSQFFIVHEDSPHLDGDYAVFGFVTEGMDLIDEICENTPVQDRNGKVKSEDQPIITSIVITQ